MKITKGKWIFITGAASGIGFETAIEFAKRGANIVLTDLTLNSLASVKTSVEALGVLSEVFELDVTNFARFTEINAELMMKNIEVDVMINNAGIGWFGSFEEHTIEKWRLIFDINVMGVVHGTQTFLAQFKASGNEKHIVNIASLAAISPAMNMAAYATSKSVVMGMTDALGIECIGTKVGVTCVHPGIINTPIVKAKDIGASITDDHLRNLERYYVEHGSLPSVVAYDIVKAVENNEVRLYTGASATSTSLLKRLLPRQF